MVGERSAFPKPDSSHFHSIVKGYSPPQKCPSCLCPPTIFFETGSNPGWLRTCPPPASASCVLGSKVCTTRPSKSHPSLRQGPVNSACLRNSTVLTRSNSRTPRHSTVKLRPHSSYACLPSTSSAPRNH